MTKTDYMKEALKEAIKAKEIDEVPVGCVIVDNGEIIAKAHNLKESKHSSLYHAEINAIKIACDHFNNWHLDDCELYVTLEPCLMCTGAIINSRIKKVYFAASDPKGGAFISNVRIDEIPNLNHYPEYEAGLLKEEAAALLKEFFKSKRRRK